ncbi:hypothetical protein [Flavobacterium gilvum]|uniref:Uncharacterized protein n=1 Tax=Flavobacterium gilvum TaxID=1492737 RepID=A0AAC9I6J5_9FLAO|nr:hypothetical protein [Flavobacterium gilvum]AOW08822.1 hypothetical protein EM308_04500 [Flavobacterium gilvum]KFC61196.1 hypothetical protein FEM08_00350 [Flavobacterium gilvum]
MIKTLKNYFNTTKTVKSFAIFWLCLIPFELFSQSAEKQAIQVEKMEYTYNSSISETENGSNSFSNTRIILADNPEIADKMKQSILTAINNRWNTVVSNPKWDFKEISRNNKSPKFKTELKKGTPGNWHLFLQVIDRGPYPITDKSNLFFNTYPPFESLDYAPYFLQFKVSIVDGNNGSSIFSNEMMVEMKRTAVPAGQILLQKLPAFTDSFLQAFDKAVQTLFAPASQSELKLDVTPACLFLDTDKTLAKAKKLNFVSKNDSVIELIQLKQEWIVQNSKTRKTKRVNNFGNNLFNTVLTSSTGISSDKIRAMRYITKFSFTDTNDNAHYFCEIPFIEETRQEKERETSRDADGTKTYNNHLNGNKSVTRIFEPKQLYYLIREKDTIAHFKITKGNRFSSKNHFSQYWDGKNESTISKMPEFWNNPSSEQNKYPNPFVLEGELNKLPFVIENSKAGNQIDIEISGQEIMTLKIYNNKPVLGLMYPNTADEKTTNILLMLSTMPFNLILF